MSELLGEAVTLTALLGSLVHANGKLIVQTKTDGPVGLIAVNYEVRGG